VADHGKVVTGVMPDGLPISGCTCGWEPPYPPGTKRAMRSLGQHVGRANRASR
jgi:hypothetical protein